MKDGPKRRSNRKGRGEAEKEVKSREKRCAKIADLLVAGKKGADLEVAIQEYDCTLENSAKTKEEDFTVTAMSSQIDEHDDKKLPTPVLDLPPAVQGDSKTLVAQVPASNETRSKTPGPTWDNKFKVPLTAMFKRSSSAPAAHNRSIDSSYCYVGRRGSLSDAPSCAFADTSFLNYLAPAVGHEVQPRVDCDIGLSDEHRDGAVSDCMGATHIPNPLVLDSDFQHFSDRSVPWNKVRPTFCIVYSLS